MGRLLLTILSSVGWVVLAGCVATPLNPAFSVSSQRAEYELAIMAQQPRSLQRPVVVLGGFADPGIAPARIRDAIRKATGDGRILGISFGACSTFDACRNRVVAAVDEYFPTEDPTATTEVDVVAHSMGGLVARYAALPSPGVRRLKMARLFTISTPHRGAELARLPALTPLQRDMRPGSEFLVRLDEAVRQADYELIPYVRLKDAVVGQSNAAPPGQGVWWVPAPPGELSHSESFSDHRILADIVRRLRSETPYTLGQPLPLP